MKVRRRRANKPCFEEHVVDTDCMLEKAKKAAHKSTTPDEDLPDIDGHDESIAELPSSFSDEDEEIDLTNLTEE